MCNDRDCEREAMKCVKNVASMLRRVRSTWSIAQMSGKECVEAPEYKKNGREASTRIRGSGGGSAVAK